jgi:hypothetical protein
MASDGRPVQIPATSLVHGSQAPTTVTVQSGGKPLPASGKAAAAPAALRATEPAQSVQAQVALINKYLNDSGQPDQFRIDPGSDNKLIQQINPANGAVIGEYSAEEFPALAQSLGLRMSGALVNRLA